MPIIKAVFNQKSKFPLRQLPGGPRLLDYYAIFRHVRASFRATGRIRRG
jgi:hypothetical protein